MFPQNGRGQQGDEVIGIAILVFAIIIVVVAITCFIYFLLTISRCLREVHPENRAMEPGQVWLNLIPCFNIVWCFLTVTRVSESLDREYRDRRWRTRGEDFGKTVGMWWCIGNVTGWIPLIGPILSLVSLICWIIYWIKIAGFKRELMERSGGSRRGDSERNRYDEYDDDDRRDRRRRRDDDDGYDDEDDYDDDRRRR